MAKRKAKKTGISNATIAEKIKAVTTAIKRGAKTVAVKAIIKCAVLTVTACGSSFHPSLDVASQNEAGQPAIVESAGREGGAIADAGAVNVPDATASEGGAGGDINNPMGNAGAAGAADAEPPVDPLCPQGVWAVCDAVGYGYACQMDAGFGQTYQFACNYYCDDDTVPGVVVPDRATRCDAAGGTCHCLGGLDDAGACSNRYECDPTPDTMYPDAGQ